MIRARGGSLEVRVPLGPDPITRRKRHRYETIRGTDKAAWAKAKAREAELLGQVLEGRALRRDGHTVGQLLDRWLEFARIEESTRYQARSALDRHVRPAFGGVKVERVRAEDLDALYHALERGRKNRKGEWDQRPLAPATVRRLHATLRTVFAQAVRWEWIARNPVERATPPPAGTREPVAPPTDAVRRLVAHLLEEVDGKAREPDLAMLLRLDAVTGARRGEVLALRRSDLDLVDGSVKVQRALGQGQGAPYVKSTKTGVRHALALDEETVGQLTRFLKLQDELASECGVEVGRDAYLFSHHVDRAVPLRPEWVTKRVKIRRDEVKGCEGVTLRALRHWMATEGVDFASVKAVSGRGGWARTSTMTDIYASHLPPTDVALARGLAARLDAES